MISFYALTSSSIGECVHVNFRKCRPALGLGIGVKAWVHSECAIDAYLSGPWFSVSSCPRHPVTLPLTGTRAFRHMSLVIRLVRGCLKKKETVDG